MLNSYNRNKLLLKVFLIAVVSYGQFILAGARENFIEDAKLIDENLADLKESQLHFF